MLGAILDAGDTGMKRADGILPFWAHVLVHVRMRVHVCVCVSGGDSKQVSKSIMPGSRVGQQDLGRMGIIDLKAAWKNIGSKMGLRNNKEAVTA